MIMNIPFQGVQDIVHPETLVEFRSFGNLALRLR